MNEEILRIQKMVAEGKVTPEEAAELIESVRQAEGRNWTEPTTTRAPTVKSAIAEGFDAIGRWPLSKVLLLVLAVLIVGLFPPVGVIGVIALVVYYRGQRRARERAAVQRQPTPGAPGAIPWAAPQITAVATNAPSRKAYGVAGLAALLVGLVLLVVAAVLNDERAGLLVLGGGLLWSAAVVLGLIGWRSPWGKIAAITGSITLALLLAAAFFWLMWSDSASAPAPPQLRPRHDAPPQLSPGES
jgi:hypothetical protein